MFWAIGAKLWIWDDFWMVSKCCSLMQMLYLICWFYSPFRLSRLLLFNFLWLWHTSCMQPRFSFYFSAKQDNACSRHRIALLTQYIILYAIFIWKAKNFWFFTISFSVLLHVAWNLMAISQPKSKRESHHD